MSDFGKETCVTAITAPVADPESSHFAAQDDFFEAEDVDIPPEEFRESLSRCWNELISPLMRRLDGHVDSRLVCTFGRAIQSIIKHRNPRTGLLLSELGGFIVDGAHAPAGTKRLSNLLRSPKWDSSEIDEYLWAQALSRWTDMVRGAKDALILWDESVVEKPESLKSEGLCPVRSSHAKRLSRIKPGYYRRPGAPIFVPGINWLAALLIGRSGPPTVAAMRWWGTRNPKLVQGDVIAQEETGPDWLSTGRLQGRELLTRFQKDYGMGVVHVFDRGYAGGPWLSTLGDEGVRFIVRWPKYYKIYAITGNHLPAWRIFAGKRFQSSREIRDARRKKVYKAGLKFAKVSHPSYGGGNWPLWLVVSSQGQGREPLYLLTNEDIQSEKDGWDIVMSYMRRWQIEMAFRFQKSELALESPRLWTWERRKKLLLMATLAYSFLLELLSLPKIWSKTLLRHWYHRTGKRCRETPTPLYRIRAALAAYLSHGTLDLEVIQSSG